MRIAMGMSISRIEPYVVSAEDTKPGARECAKPSRSGGAAENSRYAPGFRRGLRACGTGLTSTGTGGPARCVLREDAFVHASCASSATGGGHLA